MFLENRGCPEYGLFADVAQGISVDEVVQIYQDFDLFLP